MKYAKIALSAVAIIFSTRLATARETVIYFNVPSSDYAQSDNPPCSTAIRFTDMISDHEVIDAIASQSPEAAAITFSTSKAMAYIQKNFGGEISRWVTEATGGSRSTCMSQFVVLPKGATLTQINLSDRDGREGWHYLGTDRDDYVVSGTPYSNHYFRAVKHGGVLNTGSTGDYAGWTGVVIFNEGGRTVVTATAKNWSHNKDTQQVMRVVWEP